MTLSIIMSAARQRHNSDNEIIFERLKKSSYRAVRALVSEIVGNYRRVRLFFSSLLVLCSYYVFTLKCSIQNTLEGVKRTAKECEKNLEYDAPLISKLKYEIYWKHVGREKINYTKCMCSKGIHQTDESALSYDAECVALWLSSKNIRVSFADNSLWNDGVLLHDILHQVTKGGDVKFEKLDPSKKVRNWSLVIKLINCWYPGLIQNNLLPHCVIASKTVNVAHVVYILTRLMHARRRAWKAGMLRWMLSATEGLNGLLKPRYSLSGPGTVYAKLSMRNEFVIRSKFSCPTFTVELEDENGEIWRETTANARVKTAQEEEYADVNYTTTESEVPLEIVKISKNHYRIFYCPRRRTVYKISVKPGINKGGHVYGSPFQVQAEPASYWRNTMTEKENTRKLSSVNAPGIQFLPSASGRSQSPIEECDTQEESPSKADSNSNGAVKNSRSKYDDYPVGEEQDGLGVKSDPNLGLRKMTSIFRHIGTRFTSVSHRVFSSVSGRGAAPVKMPSESTPRRNYTNFYTGKISRSVDSNELIVPSSRKLRIRKVIIHRYLNKAMPCLEEYFFGQSGFSVDVGDDDEKTNAGRRWSNISALLRAKMRMLSKTREGDELSRKGPTKYRRFDPENGRRRRLRLQRSDGILQGNRTSRKSSDDIFRRRKSAHASSSSSESGYECNELSLNPNDSSDVQVNSNDPTPGKPPKNHDKASVSSIPRFNHIFEDEDGLADILLRTAIPTKQRNPNLTDSVAVGGHPPSRKSGKELIRFSINNEGGSPNRNEEISEYSNTKPDRLRKKNHLHKNEQNTSSVHVHCSYNIIEYAQRIALRVVRSAEREFAGRRIPTS